MSSALKYDGELMFPQDILNDLNNRIKELESRPAVKLRWHQQMNRVTAAEISKARGRSVFPLMAVKALLEDKSPRVLQYYDDVAGAPTGKR